MSSFERLTAPHGALLIVDVQKKLVDLIPSRDLVVANAVRLVRAARALGMPIHATEQYPKGLGPTVPELAELIPHRPDKTAFRCCAVPELVEQLVARGIRHVTLAGIEAHVCVTQTCLDLLDCGLRVFVVTDAVSSRAESNYRCGLDRMPALAARFHVQEKGLVAWTFGCCPTPAWAESLFGEPDVARLWDLLAPILRLDQPDPAAAWQSRLGQLRPGRRSSPPCIWTRCSSPARVPISPSA